MEKQRFNPETGIKIFIVVSALIGLAMGLSDSILSNYFKEAYQVNAQQRGFIEFPRELPGILSMLVIAALSFIGNIRSAIIAQALCIVGLLVLGLVRPEFSGMLIFLFIFSMGVHMYMPLSDGIGLSLAGSNGMGKTLGMFNSVKMGFLMLAGIITFFGFRLKWFSFETPVAVFLVSAAVLIAAAVFLVILSKSGCIEDSSAPKIKLVFRKEYIRYYIICALFGGRKQIMLVYSPWVLIELLDFKTDTMSILAVIGSLVGIFFMPAVGRWIDKLGVRTVMMMEALVFVLIYTAYGFLSKWVSVNAVTLTGIAMLLVYLLNILDRMSAQFAMVRAIYMRSIAIVPEDVTISLSMGMGIDHVVAIAGSYVCGLIWYRWGPEYVFLIAGALSLMNLLVVRGISREKQPA